ncbi:MAG: NUDIX hydrolase [Clostridia bacterium]|nr:NUDIX hydrolase [Clostridia bacterium]
MQKTQNGTLMASVDLLIVTVRAGKCSVLLSRRTSEPFEGKLALAGSLIRADESAEEAAGRLLEEMLPVQGTYMEQLYTFSEVRRDPRGRVISLAYLVMVPWGRLKGYLERGESSFQAFDVGIQEDRLQMLGDDGAEVKPGDLAFDHAKILETGIRRIRGKVDYTDIAFRLLENPGCFTFSELQTIFEALLFQHLDGSNFRRNIQSRYQGQLHPAEKTGDGGDPPKAQRRGRPSQMYAFTFDT